MRKSAIVVAVLLAFAAWAGSRAKESGSTAPSAATDGVSLSEVTGCRVSVRLDAGTLGSGGKLIVSYYDPVLGWVQSASTLHCDVTATSADGGTRTVYVCPDMRPAAAVGRIAVHAWGIVSDDGGTGAVRARVECQGPNLP